MPIGLLESILGAKPENARILGMDLGKKTIGLSVSDSGQGIATPLKTITRTKFTRDIQELKTVIDDYDIGGYVLGYPLNMDGSEGRRCDAVRSFADELSKCPHIVGPDPWIALWDERLSTVSVENLVDDYVSKRKTRVQSKESGLIDKLAAQHILQGALEFMKKRERGATES